jgi:hypothetical protein
MKASLRFILCLWATWLAGVVCVAQPPDAGKVLVLDNDRILEGDIERVGEQYRIRRAAGETLLPVNKARTLCRSMEEAYVFLRDSANLEDPDERLRLAHWCRLHGLPDQALHEATSSLKLRPTHEPTRRLIQLLERPEAATARAETTAAPAASESAVPPPPVDFNSETLGMFVTKVQPILMNTCVSCHNDARGGAFKLTRAYADRQANPRAIRHNLAAVLAQVRRDQPGESPFLSWAVTVHGKADKAPIKDRQAPAYRALEEWVKLAVKGTALRIEPSPPPAPEVRLEPEPARPAVPIRSPEPFAVSMPSEPKAEPVPEAKPAPVETPVASPQVAPAAPNDPFDPAIFNQQNPRK